MANSLVTGLRRVFGGRLTEAVSASAEPQLQRGGSKKKDDVAADIALEESVTAASRKSAEKSGDTMEGGKYPIRNQSEANKAWDLRNSGKADEASVVAHIRAQVKKHGLTMPGSKTKESAVLQAGERVEAPRLQMLIREATVKKADGGYEVTIVREGPGNPTDKRYYSKQALQKAVTDGKFEGLQAYLNHPTRVEERDRPERDVTAIAGHFTEARFVDGSPAEVRAKFIPGGMDKDRVISLIESAISSPADKPLIGISIDGYGHTDKKDINGVSYHVVREVTHLGSADIVTRAGAGGRFHRRMQESSINPGMAKGRPDTSKEATMNAAELQNKVRAAASKLAEASALADGDETAGPMIEEGLSMLREAADAKIESETVEKIVEKRVEVPVAAGDEKADELAVKVRETETKLTEAVAAVDAEKAAHKDTADELAIMKSAQSAVKVMREADVPAKLQDAWFADVAAKQDETAMVAMVERKLAERQAILDEVRESVGVEGAGPRVPALAGSTNGSGGLYGLLGLDRDDD